MPVTAQQAEQLAELALACRPYGAPRWDRQGTYAAIGKVRSRSLASVIIAVVQAAEDAHAETPGVIPTDGPHWRQPIPGDRPAATPPKREEACVTCGRHLTGCICGEQRTKPPERSHRHADHVAAARAALTDARGRLCVHGATVCHDCERTRPEEAG